MCLAVKLYQFGLWKIIVQEWKSMYLFGLPPNDHVIRWDNDCDHVPVQMQVFVKIAKFGDDCQIWRDCQNWQSHPADLTYAAGKHKSPLL